MKRGSSLGSVHHPLGRRRALLAANGFTRRAAAVGVGVIFVLSVIVGSTGVSSGSAGAVTFRTTAAAHAYWLVAADGGVFTFGDAGFYGSLGNARLIAPIVGMASTPDGKGYWLVGADGGVFAFGDAGFYGSLGNVRLDAPIVGMASTPDGKGYWLVGADGGVFTFGDAGFHGSLANFRLNAPIVSMTPSYDAHGYYLVGADGGVFTFGDALFGGSFVATVLDQFQGDPTIVGIGLIAPSSFHGSGIYAVASNGQTKTDGGPDLTDQVTWPLQVDGPVIAFCGTRYVTPRGEVAGMYTTYRFPGLTAVHLNAPVVGIATPATRTS
jgi:hypothetical protein